MLSLKNLKGYDSPELIQRLQLILPPYLQERWNRRSYNSRRKRHVEAGLDAFLEFVEEETMLVNDPNFSKEALFEAKEDTTRAIQKKLVKTMLTEPVSVRSKPCSKCDKLHNLDECDQYLQLTVDERQEFLFKNRLCFSCYDATTEGHTARTCSKRRKCTICKEQHPTGLQGYRRKGKPPDIQKKRTGADVQQRPTSVTGASVKSINANCLRLCTEVISLNIVPVKITHPASSVVVLTKALLDNGNQGTFIHENVLDQLKVQTASTVISVKTMNGVATEPCKAVNNLRNH